MTMSLEIARALLAGTQVAARERGLQPLTVVILDAGGHIVAGEREDGSSSGRFAVAHGKAHGALTMGRGSRALMERAEQQGYFISAVSRVAGPLIPVPGGVLVRDASGRLLGAVGVSGDSSDNDEAVALAGVHAAGLVGQPD